MPVSDHRSLAVHVDRWVLGATVIGALSLALLATHPLDGGSLPPRSLLFFAGAALSAGLLRFLLVGKRDERWLALASLLGLLGYVGATEPWSKDSAAEFASTTTALLSTTHMGVAVVALVAAWLCLGVGLLCGRAVLLCLPGEGPWQRGSAWTIGLLVATFGAHGVMGYASGNSSLLLP